ncbi:hypothetical protein KFL_000800360 [Klebsormidium nitens]|uniref:Uncharacterized protein n=1 Tax=Klebsormidium nitens TaxID=105231 RepID=A0A1Y1HW78_KLENI|nr:hypothetical protein KFL_000800360 [Klebsormidium nitens]|eukprot:GAQ81459.1 hypothetical protein KFL_000800360 [Klebsormidium nitens]
MSTRTVAVLLVAVCLPFLVAGQAPAPAPAKPAGPGGRPHGTMNGSLPLNGTLPDRESYFNGTLPFNGTFNGTMPPFRNGSEPGMGRRGGPGSPMGAPFGAPRGAPPNMTNFNFTGLNGTFPCRPRGGPRNNQTATPTTTPTPTPTSTA